jgi:DNA-binding response OmpR family regulator
MERESGLQRSVLVVDDEPNIVLSIEFLLRQAGYEVRTARDGHAALQAVAERAPDLILLDVMLPGRNGYEVCQSIRESGRSDMKIIMLTAKSRDAEQEKGLALGADEYVTKPFSTTDLMDRVRRMLGPAPAQGAGADA